MFRLSCPFCAMDLGMSGPGIETGYIDMIYKGNQSTEAIFVRCQLIIKAVSDCRYGYMHALFASSAVEVMLYNQSSIPAIINVSGGILPAWIYLVRSVRFRL